MNRYAPLVGLLLVGVLMGTLISLPSSQILIPFIIEQQVVYNPTSYLSNHTFYAGETGSMNLANIMQIVVYTSSVTITASTLARNTTLAFSSLNFTLNFGTAKLLLNGLQNMTQSITLSNGIYPVSLTIDYAASTSIPTPVEGSASIILTAP